jgi:hypothetical protein
MALVCWIHGRALEPTLPFSRFSLALSHSALSFHSHSHSPSQHGVSHTDGCGEGGRRKYAAAAEEAQAASTELRFSNRQQGAEVERAKQSVAAEKQRNRESLARLRCAPPLS